MHSNSTFAPERMKQADTTDAEVVRLWLHGRSVHTQRAYRHDIGRFLAYVRRPLAQVTLGALQDFADSLQISDSSRRRKLAAVKSLLAFGHRLGYLPFDVGRALRQPAVRNRLAERILPEADIRRMLSLETDERNRAILTLLYASGVRVSELCGLRWRDLQPNGDGAQISVFGKGGKTRAIRLPASVWQQLDRLRGAADGAQPLFRSPKKGNALTAQWVLRIVRRAAKRAGIDVPVSPHWLRHAHASHALDRGAPIHLVQQTLGHTSIATTGIYLHTRPGESSSRFLDAAADGRCIRSLPELPESLSSPRPPEAPEPLEVKYKYLSEQIMKLAAGYLKKRPRAAQANVLKALGIAYERVRNKPDSYFCETEPPESVEVPLLFGC